MSPRATPFVSAIRAGELRPRLGRVRHYVGSVLESSGPDAALGELCEVYPPGRARPVIAETVGFRDGNVLMIPHGDLQGIRPGSEVVATGKVARVPVGRALLGRVIDATGAALDDRPPPAVEEYRPLYAEPANPVKRERIRHIFETKVRAIDTLLTVGIGQRVGIFAGSGVGKSTLLGMVTQSSNADVNVIALIGERGREVREFLEIQLGGALSRSVVVVATAEQSPLMRSQAAFAATAIAEYFRDQGLNVALLLDSLTRFAMARREIGLAVGEPPTSRGYTPSVFGLLPKLLERAGPGELGKGSITGFYTVLVEGDDMNEPVADHCRAILDGHFVLSREIANRGRFPPLDPLKSVSRLIGHLTKPDEQRLVAEVIGILATYADARDLVDLGSYKPGSNKAIDTALRLQPELEKFLAQRADDATPRATSMASLRRILQEPSR